MGLGPLNAVYQARFHALSETEAPETHTKIWAFVGDGEMDEPESLAGFRSPRARGSTT